MDTDAEIDDLRILPSAPTRGKLKVDPTNGRTKYRRSTTVRTTHNCAGTKSDFQRDSHRYLMTRCQPNRVRQIRPSSTVTGNQTLLWSSTPAGPKPSNARSSQPGQCHRQNPDRAKPVHATPASSQSAMQKLDKRVALHVR